LAGVTVKVIFQDIRKIESDAIVVGCFEDVRPLKGFAGQLDWLLCGSMSKLLLTSRIRGTLGDVALLTSRGKVPSPKIFMMGLGRRSGFSLSTLRDAARNAAESVLSAGASQVVIEYLRPSGTAPEDGIPALQEGLKAGAGGRSLAVSLLAPDRESFEKLSGAVKA